MIAISATSNSRLRTTRLNVGGDAALELGELEVLRARAELLRDRIVADERL